MSDSKTCWLEAVWRGSGVRRYCRLAVKRMHTTVSAKFQVVIPLKVRDALNLRPGQKMQVLLLGNSVQLVPLRHMREYRGLARGIGTTVERETEDRP